MSRRTIDSRDVLVIEHVNLDKGYRYGEYDEPLAAAYFVETDPETGETTVDTGEVYRACQSEYGRCVSKVYVDPADGGAPKVVGWVFVKRERYEDTGGPFLSETWVTFARRNPRYSWETP